MYASKECQSKCIRNTVRSLLILARAFVPLCPVISVDARQRQEGWSPHRLAQVQRDVRASAVSFSGVLRKACWSAWSYRCFSSRSWPDSVPAAQMEFSASEGRRARAADLGGWHVEFKGWCRASVAWSRSGLEEGRGAGTKEEGDSSSQDRGCQWVFSLCLAVRCSLPASVLHSATQSHAAKPDTSVVIHTAISTPAWHSGSTESANTWAP